VSTLRPGERLTDHRARPTRDAPAAAAPARWGDAADRAACAGRCLPGRSCSPLLLSSPGRMTFDTKLAWTSTIGFLRALWHLWNPLEYLAAFRISTSGYAFHGRVLPGRPPPCCTMPVFAAERGWDVAADRRGLPGPGPSGLGAGIGMPATRLLAGARSRCWPTFTIRIGSSSAACFPGLSWPCAVLPLTRTGRPGRRPHGLASWSACIGASTPSSTLAVLVLPGMYLLTRPGRRRLALSCWWCRRCCSQSAGGSGPLLYQAATGHFLAYIEQSATPP